MKLSMSPHDFIVRYFATVRPSGALWTPASSAEDCGYDAIKLPPGVQLAASLLDFAAKNQARPGEANRTNEEIAALFDARFSDVVAAPTGWVFTPRQSATPATAPSTIGAAPYAEFAALCAAVAKLGK